MLKRAMFIMVFVAFASVCLCSWAQAPAGDKPEEPANPAYFKAAVGLLEAMNTENTLKTQIDQMLDLQVRQQPMLRPYQEVMRTFFTKHMSWDVLKDDLAKLYMQEFTEKELNEITAFCKTPAGKKMAHKLPLLMQKQAMVGAKRIQGNLTELQQMIMAERAKQMPAPEQATPQP